MKLKFSSVGKETFQRWKTSFPPLEIKVSTVGNFIFQGWKVFGKLSGRSALPLLWH